MKRPFIMALGIGVCLCVGRQALVAQTQGISIQEVMTAEDFRQAGLAKLTPTELAALNRWLVTYTGAVVQVARSSQGATTQNPAKPEPAAPQVIETCIDGEFSGWDGETIFKLCNGQIWQQVEYAYTYHYAYRPDVLIYKGRGGYRMRVEDVDETIGVARIK